MKISMYQATVPVFQHFLTALSDNLGIAADFCARRKVEETWLIQARLYPDMYPLLRQVGRATDHARRCTATLAGVPFEEVAETEQSLADLQGRIAATLAFLGNVSAAQLEGSDERQITVKIARADRSLSGLRYLHYHALPQFYFHTTTAYDILRHCGVELGKRHFLALPADFAS